MGEPPPSVAMIERISKGQRESRKKRICSFERFGPAKYSCSNANCESFLGFLEESDRTTKETKSTAKLQDHLVVIPMIIPEAHECDQIDERVKRV